MTATRSSRLISLDAFRGYTVAAMILVNFPGTEEHVFFTLRHTVWNGLSLTDLVAPFFLFIVGMSIALAYSPRLEARVARRPLYRKILGRSLKIYAVGMLLNAIPDFDWSNLRYTGTLHRIAIVYLISAILFLNTTWKQQAWIAAAVLLGYWIIMLSVPTPDEGRVLLLPGRNIAAWFDRKYLPGTMWQGTWDPEGILSTFPSVATCITGMLTGKLMISERPVPIKLNLVFLAGVITASVGYLVGLSFPVNENLWTSSFVLVTSGFACLVFASMYLVTEVLDFRRWAWPGVVFGTNAITVYVLGDVFALFFYRFSIGGLPLNEFVVGRLIGLGLHPELASLFYGLTYVTVLFIPAWILYRKKIFIKL